MRQVELTIDKLKNMNNMKYKLIYLACLSLLFVSCKETQELRYPNEFSGLNIWLGANAQKADSLTYNYAFKSLNEFDTIKFSVRLTGLPSAVDREFTLKAIGGDTLRIKKDVHYQFPKYVLKANTYEGIFPIYIKRSSEFKAKEGKKFEVYEQVFTVKDGNKRNKETNHVKEEYVFIPYANMEVNCDDCYEKVTEKPHEALLEFLNAR